MNYLEDRTKKVQKLHSIYSEEKEIPDVIKKLIEIPEVKRLSAIDQNAGIERSGFNIFNYNYSILDHSLGFALILNNFVSNKKQVIAALLHDIDVPAFVYSTMQVDKKNYDSKEDELTVFDAIVGSDKLFEYFLKNEISIDEMCDYTKYPIAYNVVPHLCAHRLEYFLHTMYFNDMCTTDEIREIYNDLLIIPNEENMPEFCFNTPEIAKKFCLLSVECGEAYRSYESKASMQFISDTLGAMLRREVISRKDLYTYGDKVIMEMGLNCSDKRISDRWKYLPELKKVYTKFNVLEDKKCNKMKSNLVYADVLIRDKNANVTRTSKRFTECKEAINRFLNSDTDLYFYIDYED